MSWAVGNSCIATGAGASGSIASPSYTSVLGNLILVGVRQSTTGTTTTGVTDTLGNTYYQLGTIGSSGRLDLWACFGSIGSGSNTVTAAFSATPSNRGIVVTEFSGGRGISLQDVLTPTTATSSTITSAAHNALSAASLEVWYADVNTAATTWTAGSGFAITQQDATAGAMQYQVFSGVQQGITTQFTNSNSGTIKHYIVAVFTEDQGAGGGGGSFGSFG